VNDASVAAERSLASTGVVIGVDEVGRGALAGPVMVGAVAIDVATTEDIPGLRDSKVLSPKRRETLVPMIEQWCLAFAIGEASNAEIDEHGIVPALQLATTRALTKIAVTADVVVLDGTSDWLSGHIRVGTQIHTEARADQRYASVAAASVLAKVARDSLMMRLHTLRPEYEWDRNKGYGSAEHMQALRTLGACEWHRRSWRLPSTS
jgi:ribonuclease HII